MLIFPVSGCGALQVDFLRSLVVQHGLSVLVIIPNAILSQDALANIAND